MSLLHRKRSLGDYGLMTSHWNFQKNAKFKRDAHLLTK